MGNYKAQRAASYLLPIPGGEVVRELIDTLEKQESDLLKIVEDMFKHGPNIPSRYWANEIKEKLLEKK